MKKQLLREIVNYITYQRSLVNGNFIFVFSVKFLTPPGDVLSKIKSLFNNFEKKGEIKVTF